MERTVKGNFVEENKKSVPLNERHTKKRSLIVVTQFQIRKDAEKRGTLFAKVVSPADSMKLCDN